MCHGSVTSQPQSTGRLTPVIAEASSLAQEADGACNFFWAYHPAERGIFVDLGDVALALIDGGLKLRRSACSPASTTLTRTPERPHSAARHSVMAMTAALAGA